MGLCTNKNVTLRYETKGPRQCARFYVDAESVPEAERTTTIIKVAEVKLEDDDDDAPRYKTKMTTTVPEAVFEAMQRGETVPGDAVARLNQCITAHGPTCAEAMRLWDALRGLSPICLFFS